MEVETGLLDHLSDGLLDIFHVRGLHAVAAGAARHSTATWCVPAHHFVEIFQIRLRQKFILQNQAEPVEIHIGADGSAALESAQVGISCILNIKAANCFTPILNQSKLTIQV